jgi:hypothetical protein
MAIQIFKYINEASNVLGIYCAPPFIHGAGENCLQRLPKDDVGGSAT